MKDEFTGKPFYPAKFFWRISEDEETKEACRVLNKLTPEQIKAVEYYARSVYDEAVYDNCED